MADYGSYFLWHIKLEGIKIFEKYDFLSKILEHLRKYNRVESDIKEYIDIIKDIEFSLQNDDTTLNYELNLIASIIRNSAISILFLKNIYLFGRVSPVKMCLDIYGNRLRFNIEEYKELYKFRLLYSRKDKDINVINISKENVYNWLNQTKGILDIALELLNKEV